MISYAVSGSDNEFRVYDYNSLQISVKTTYATPATGVSVNDGLWHHVAVTWRRSDGRVQIYKDGTLAFTGNIAAGTSITGGGALVLGQDQDVVGGGFDPRQACRGLLDEVRIYNRVLTQAEIQSDMGAPINATDTIPPTINNLAATPWRPTAVVTWTTTEPADSQVEYGLTPSYTSVSPLDATPVVSHALTLNGLQPNTTYHYRVRSRDAAGNLTLSTDQTFTTLPSAAPTGVKVAFLGDQGLGSNATSVLQLIRNEGAQAVVHLGDLDMADNPGRSASAPWPPWPRPCATPHRLAHLPDEQFRQPDGGLDGKYPATFAGADFRVCLQPGGKQHSAAGVEWGLVGVHLYLYPGS